MAAAVESVVVVVDVGAAMGADLDSARKAVQMMINNKACMHACADRGRNGFEFIDFRKQILHTKKDRVALVLFGTTGTTIGN
jgi:hypothetical protein